MTVKAPDGKAVSVKLADNYTVVGVSRAKIDDIGAGKFIGTATLGERNGGWSRSRCTSSPRRCAASARGTIPGT